MKEKLPLLKNVNDKVLNLAYEIQPYTIDEIMAMKTRGIGIAASIWKIEVLARGLKSKSYSNFLFHLCGGFRSYSCYTSTNVSTM